MTQVAEKHQPWTAVLEERPTTGPRWLQEIRDRGAARFAHLGFPTVRNEEWRFTSVSQIAGADLAPAPASTTLEASRLDTFLYADAPHRLVFVNGRFVAALSRTANLPDGMRFGSLAQAIAGDSSDVERLFGQDVDVDTRAFAALNSAFAADGAYVSVPDGVVLDAPLQLLFVSSTASRVVLASGDDDDASADAHRARREQPVPNRRDVRRPSRPDLLHQRGDGGRRRRERRARSLQGAGGEPRRVPHREHARQCGTQRELLVALFCLGREAGPERHRSPRWPEPAPSVR